MKMRKLWVVPCLLLGLHVGCFDQMAEAPLAPAGSSIAPPGGLSAKVGDGEITLAWSAVANASGYRVYRAVDVPGKPARVADVTAPAYRDDDVQNGRSYFYSVSSLDESKLEGKRSLEIEAVPELYSILINGGDHSTGSTAVALTLTAPGSTELMMIGSDPTLDGGVWENYAEQRTWRLAGADGVKKVYAAFRDHNGAFSPVVCDSIVLDTYAMIASIDIRPVPRVYSPGATVHFAMRVEGDETGGSASVALEAFGLRVDLYDDGRGGDGTANDGVYEANYRLSSAIRGKEIVVTGDFMDRAGNAAPHFECPDRIAITDVPLPVQLLGVADSSTTSITIKWVASQDEHFAGYRIYRSVSPGVTATPANLVREIPNAAQTSYPDGELMEGVCYHYRIFVVNDLMETAGSNEITGCTFDAYPDPVVLDDPSSVGNGRATLTWSENTSTDFKEYRLYRATQPGVTMSSTLVTTITERERTYFDDSGLDLVNNLYYYRLYVLDLKGKNSRSNEVHTVH